MAAAFLSLNQDDHGPPLLVGVLLANLMSWLWPDRPCGIGRSTIVRARTRFHRRRARRQARRAQLIYVSAIAGFPNEEVSERLGV